METAACQASLSFIISRSLLKLMSIESVMPSYHLILCCPFNSYSKIYTPWLSYSFNTENLDYIFNLKKKSQYEHCFF